MCCDADWKREVVPDHKFDFINIRDFHKTDFFTRIKYVWRYALFFKSLTVYGLDIFIAVTMISSEHWTNSIAQRCGNDCAVPVRFDIAKWIFVGCIIFSFLLLGYETWKAKNVVESRDISYAFTNLIANDYYSFKNYDNFCLFCHINSSTKRKDDFAFWIFFTFKEWKRLLLADGPRQSINALVLYSFAYSYGFQTHDIPAYWDRSPITAMLLFAMIATVLIFAVSLVLLIAAALLYVPLLCYIQGNLKEYVCHKVDKRIAELIKKKAKQRIARQAALEKRYAGSITSNKSKSPKGDILLPPGGIPQPTLPQVDLDDDVWRAKRKADRAGIEIPTRRAGASSPLDFDDGIYPGPPPVAASYKTQNQYPPRLDYDQPYSQGSYRSDDFSSSSNLVGNAAPLGISYPPQASRPNFPPSHSSRDLYPRQRTPEYRGYDDGGAGLAYDEPDSTPWSQPSSQSHPQSQGSYRAQWAGYGNQTYENGYGQGQAQAQAQAQGQGGYGGRRDYFDSGAGSDAGHHYPNQRGYF